MTWCRPLTKLVRYSEVEPGSLSYRTTGCGIYSSEGHIGVQGVRKFSPVSDKLYEGKDKGIV